VNCELGIGVVLCSIETRRKVLNASIHGCEMLVDLLETLVLS
jgi:hypothetical protein